MRTNQDWKHIFKTTKKSEKTMKKSTKQIVIPNILNESQLEFILDCADEVGCKTITSDLSTVVTITGTEGQLVRFQTNYSN